jgi:ubiquinone/menaquinone biosynthesis C-methylase UbiE
MVRAAAGAGPDLVVDLGSGEGRASRELRQLGYRLVGVERSPALAATAVAACPEVPVLLADAAALPLADRSAELVVACMSLMDIDDFDGAVGEIGRVLQPGGRWCTRSGLRRMRTPWTRSRSDSPGRIWSRAGIPTGSRVTGWR